MKKILAAILCVCMLISLLPFMAFADDVPGDPVVGAPLSGEGGQAQSPVGAGAAPAAEGESEGDPAPQAAAAAPLAEEGGEAAPAAAESEQKHTAQEVIDHNKAEDEKVEANKAALEKQEKRDEKAAEQAAAVEGMETTANGDSIPTDWDGELTDDPKTITITEADPEEKSGNKIKVTNIHIYVDEEAPDWFEGTDIQDDSFAISQDTLDHLVLGEWETAEMDENDTVTVSSEGKLMGSSWFQRIIDGYINGLWMPTHEFATTAVNSNWTWDNGPAMEASYNQGTTDSQPPKNFFSLFVYKFTRFGPEPERVEEYEPDYWEMPEPSGKPDPKPKPKPQPQPEDIPETEPPIEDDPIVTEPVEEIKEEIVPAAAPEVVEITEDEVPLAAAQGPVWALVNLILMVLTIWMVAMEKKGGSRVLGALLATASVVAFILTENVHNPMILVDKWTFLMAVITVVQLVVLLFSGKKEEKQETEKTEANV